MRLKILFSAIVAITSGQQCHISGFCSDSTILRVDSQPSYNHCLNQCIHSVPNCQWFTHNSQDNTCLSFSDCNRVNSTTCFTCFTGQPDCSPLPPVCFAQGFCEGPLLNYKMVDTKEECLDFCYEIPSCNVFTYNYETKYCSALSDCDAISHECETCVSGVRECKDLTKLFIVGGESPTPTDQPEVIDLSRTDSTCSQPSVYPISTTQGLTYAVGTFIEDRPTVCGGYNGSTTYKECYAYESSTDEWVSFASMPEIRGWSASVKINESAWWITGGVKSFTTDGYSSTVMYTKGRGFRRGVPLPIVMMQHCMARVNETHVFFHNARELVGTYMFNLVTEEWTQVQNPFQLRFLASCGLVTHSDGSSEILLAGGRGFPFGPDLNSAEFYNPSTDIWRPAPQLPTALYSTATVQLQNTIMMVGGWSVDVFSSLYILKYEEVNDRWVNYEQQMLFERRNPVAMLVPDDFVNCSR